jgi:hypothetical protein
MAKFVRIHHLEKHGFVAVMDHEDCSGEFNLNKQSLIARIANLEKSGLDVSEEKAALSAMRGNEEKAGRSILSQMADPWKSSTGTGPN